jgi:hypothetical protein
MAAAHFLERAHRIADSLKLGIAFKKGEIGSKRATSVDLAAGARGRRCAVSGGQSRNGSPTPAISSMNQQRRTVITLREMGCRSGFGSGKLGLSPDAFWREMKRGVVYGVVERGDGDDAGRVRLTFRYRSRSWCVTFEEKLDDIFRG